MKLGVDWREIAPTHLQDKEPKQPATTYNESFTAADGDALAGDLSWTEVSGDWDISGNKAILGGTSASRARCGSDVSGSDNYCSAQIGTHTSTSSSRNAGPCTRYSAAADTHYVAFLLPGIDALRMGKRVAGTFTQIGVEPDVTPSLPESYEIRCSGSTISSWQAGAQIESVTDTSISTGTRFGIAGTDSGTGKMNIVDLVAGDLSAGGGGVVDLLNGKLERPALVA